MLKRIKDLTKEEMEIVCNNHISKCNKCPLYLGKSGRFEGCIKLDTIIFKTALKKANRKIEIKADRSE